MKRANHLEDAQNSTDIKTIVVLTTAEIVPCLAAATIAIEATETTRRTTSSTLKPLYAALQLVQFTKWDQYLKKIVRDNFYEPILINETSDEYVCSVQIRNFLYLLKGLKLGHIFQPVSFAFHRQKKKEVSRYYDNLNYLSC